MLWQETSIIATNYLTLFAAINELNCFRMQDLVIFIHFPISRLGYISNSIISKTRTPHLLFLPKSLINSPLSICSLTHQINMAMASNTRISYQRLRNEGGLDEYGGAGIGRASSWTRRSRRVHLRRKLKIRIPGFKRFMRRKAKRVVSSWAKIVKRFREGQSHFGDLFAGNYLFMQVTPTSLKCLQNSSKPQLCSDFGARYYLPKVSWCSFIFAQLGAAWQCGLLHFSSYAFCNMYVQ